MKKKKKIVKMADIIRASDNTNKNYLKRDNDNFNKKTFQKNDDDPGDKNSKLESDDRFKKRGEFLKELGGLREDDEYNIKKDKHKKIFKNKQIKVITALVGFFVLVVGVYISLAIFPRATLDITTHNLPWEFNKDVVIDSNIDAMSISSATIPGEIFSQKKNIVASFDATSEQYIERKATGKIIVVNAYSSSPQALVEKTRFEDKEGHVFRLTKKITVPGAKVVDGKITPSSIVADVVADKAGEEYNIGPVDKFTIPGFLGSPRFVGFYGKSDSSMVGGVIGNVKYPTDDDVSNAKKEVENILKTQTILALKSQIPDGFVLLDDAIKLSITKIDTNKIVGSDGRFNVVGESEAFGMIFKNDDMFDMLYKKGLADLSVGESFAIKEKNNNYGEISVDFDSGKMNVSVVYNATYWPYLDREEISNKILGEDAIGLKTYVLSISNIDKLTVSFWPFWVKKVPNKQSRLILNIQ